VQSRAVQCRTVYPSSIHRRQIGDTSMTRYCPGCTCFTAPDQYNPTICCKVADSQYILRRSPDRTRVLYSTVRAMPVSDVCTEFSNASAWPRCVTHDPNRRKTCSFSSCHAILAPCLCCHLQPVRVMVSQLSVLVARVELGVEPARIPDMQPPTAVSV
jgi:hypothetical protein